MLLILIIVGGMFIGWLAQVLLGQGMRDVDWTLALVAGIGGSFVGGMLISLLAGDGLSLRPSGIIGSLVGAVIVTLVATRMRARS